jgi:DNA-directed RNA polymerase specialized sigma24 family protein
MISESLHLDLQATSGLTGDAQAKIAGFSNHFAALRPVLSAFLISRIGGDPSAAGDCLQEVAVIVWKKYENGWDAEDFRRYAFRCADIEARSYRRKCHRLGKRIVYLSPDVIQSLGNVEQEPSAHRCLADVSRWIGSHAARVARRPLRKGGKRQERCGYRQGARLQDGSALQAA